MSNDAEDAVGDDDSSRFFEGISWTPVIDATAQLVALWISCDMCGAALWGVPRVGKSEFAKYLEKVAHELFGGTLLVIRLRFDGSERFAKDVRLLRRMLSNVGVRATAARDPDILRSRFMDAVWSRCTPTTKRILIIVDEIQNVASAIYGEFAAIESCISEGGYIPFLLGIGQPELRSTVANVAKDLHIMGRMFQELREFLGLSLVQFREFLAAMDGDDLSFSNRHFPARTARGWSIVQLAEPIEAAVRSIVDLDKMNLDLFIPMAAVRQTLNYLFFFLIAEGNEDKYVTEETVLDAFERNGFKKQLMAYTKPRPLPPEPPKKREQR
jgi:hypothetical protein